MTTETIWRKLSDRLRHFVLSKGASPADADDILQQVFLRIHQRLGELQQVDRLESWVFQITRNAIVDWFRSKQQTDSLTKQDVRVPPDLSDGNLNAEIAKCVAALVAKLPSDQRRALTMYEFEGYSQKEIASQESISLSGAKSRIQRGRMNLTKILADCCQLELDRRGNVIDVKQLPDGSCGSNACDCS